jgi:FKBP-type peptidyl-prolyl cis-trans isomerase
MKNKYSLILFISAFSSCNFSGIEKKTDNQFASKENKALISDSIYKIETPYIIDNTKMNDSLHFDNGITIKYKVHGNGKSIKENDVVLIDYACALPNGKVFDTNEKMGKPIPFMVGWSMQTPGWDSVFVKLKVGDEVQIFLPAEMARGKKGIPNLIPPNSPNILSLKIIEILSPDYTDKGVNTWVINRNKDEHPLQKNDVIQMDYFASSKSYPRYDNSYKHGQTYQMTVGAINNMKGLNTAMSHAQVGDQLWILIPPEMAFGNKGLVNFVQPNESVFFTVRILKKVEK